MGKNSIDKAIDGEDYGLWVIELLSIYMGGWGKTRRGRIQQKSAGWGHVKAV